MYLNERISNTNHLIGQLPKVITSHGSFQSPNVFTVPRTGVRNEGSDKLLARPQSDFRLTSGWDPRFRISLWG